MQNTIQSWVKLIGDVVKIVGQQVIVETVNHGRNGEVYRDRHPVLVPDEKILESIKPGKKLGFSGILRRIGNRTKLVLDPKHYSLNQSKLKGKYLNQAGLQGHVVFKNFFGNDSTKKDMMTIGIGEPNTQGTALYGTIWRDTAAHWNGLLQGFNAIVRLVGYMRSREMTGANAGQTMYELVADRERSAILQRAPIQTGFETYDPASAEALMALEFDLPDEAADALNQAEDGISDQMPGGQPEDDDIPF